VALFVAFQTQHFSLRMQNKP